MATCRDCFHCEACESMLRAMGYTVDGVGRDADKRCDTFKDKNEYAKVVRCKDCKEHTDVPNDEDVICKRYHTFKKPHHFCSYGERRIE